MIKAWYFSNKECTLAYNDNRPIAKGVTHTVKGPPSLCKNGLHGSRKLIDALSYAPGPYLWQVEINGRIDEQNDKLCGNSRRYIKGFDATNILKEFARKQALINIEKIIPYTTDEDYELILKYLNTGDKSIRPAAWDAAWDAARSAAWDAAESAARSAAQSAAWDAADDMLIAMVEEKINDI